MEFSIQRADPAVELSELKTMWGLIFPDEAELPEFLWTLPSVESHWVVVRGEKVGLISIERNVDVPEAFDAPASPELPGNVYIMAVGLVPSMRGSGLGTRVFRYYVEQELQAGAKSISSNIRPSNTASERLHTRSGFKRAETKKGFYKGPDEDTIVLRINQ